MFYLDLTSFCIVGGSTCYCKATLYIFFIELSLFLVQNKEVPNGKLIKIIFQDIKRRLKVNQTRIQYGCKKIGVGGRSPSREVINSKIV